VSTMRRISLAVGMAVVLWPGSGKAQEWPASAQDPIRHETPQAAPRPIPPRAFRTPEEGFAALASAVRNHDERRLILVLGGEARRLVRSGDPAADRAARDRFASAYAERAEILHPAPNRTTLEIGKDHWPFPIPMVRRAGQTGSWRFDARQGAQELIDRRIGRNELDTLEVLRAIVVAQAEYASTVGRQGGFSIYARRIFSRPGYHDGLYWPSSDGQPESPLGPLAAAASAGGYGGSPASVNAPQPFHGYVFRLLEAQGPAASGGVMDYVVNGRMIGGFGVLAAPAEYGVSGIQTFITSHAGIIYQRNLGPATSRIARSIQTFDPGPGWEEVLQ
jgi:hypothetical protein